MSSLIELEEPYKSRWAKGYLQTHPNGRKYICLYNNTKDRSLVSYARYLKSIEVGHFLSDDVEVDHRNDDPTNDDLSNLKIMPSILNKAKQANLATKPTHDLECENCREVFTFTQRELDTKRHNGVTRIFCSRSCAAKFHNNARKKMIS